MLTKGVEIFSSRIDMKTRNLAQPAKTMYLLNHTTPNPLRLTPVEKPCKVLTSMLKKNNARLHNLYFRIVSVLKMAT